ncbi:Tubby- protein 2 [Coemansia sp. RSA 1200]|nr:Tubby- protein 2 [Coemansia sp. RSA 1200]
MSKKEEKEKGDAHDVLFRAVPLGSVTQCRVERVRAHGGRGATEFIDLYTDQIQDQQQPHQQQQQQQRVLRAKRGSRIGSSSSSPFARHVYDIVASASNDSCSPAAAIGRVVSNAAGSEFSVSEQRKSNSAGRPDAWTEVCAAVYQSGAASACAGRGAPRSTTVVIRSVDASGCAVANAVSGTGSLVSRYRSATDADADADMLASVVVLLNKKPQWDAGIGAYTLDFGGRVTLASSKNLQLVCADSDSYVAVQFGRTGRDSFALDFRFPFSPVMAFGVAVSALVCRRGIRFINMT